jgi:hypothetical protein
VARLVEITTFSDKRGNLSVLEDFQIPFSVKRIFYIYNVDHSVRAGHRHKLTYQALICLHGKCSVYNNNGTTQDVFVLDSPMKCLFLDPPDWHLLYDFEEDSILMVIASKNFDEKDYIFDRYKNDNFLKQ